MPVEEEPIFITIRDPKTEIEIEYRVTSDVALTVNKLLAGIKEEGGPPWDKGCRLARTG